MDGVRVRAENHIEAEKSNAGKRDKELGKASPNSRTSRAPARPTPSKGQKRKTQQEQVPINKTDDGRQIHAIRRPTPFVGTKGRNPDSYCRYHGTDRHTTDDC